MNDQIPREVSVPAMTVARFHAYGNSPEEVAFAAMKRRMVAAGVDPKAVRTSGINNPDPSPGSTARSMASSNEASHDSPHLADRWAAMNAWKIALSVPRQVRGAVEERSAIVEGTRSH